MISLVSKRSIIQPNVRLIGVEEVYEVNMESNTKSKLLVSALGRRSSTKSVSSVSLREIIKTEVEGKFDYMCFNYPFYYDVWTGYDSCFMNKETWIRLGGSVLTEKPEDAIPYWNPEIDPKDKPRMLVHTKQIKFSIVCQNMGGCSNDFHEIPVETDVHISNNILPWQNQYIIVLGSKVFKDITFMFYSDHDEKKAKHKKICYYSFLGHYSYRCKGML